MLGALSSPRWIKPDERRHEEGPQQIYDERPHVLWSYRVYFVMDMQQPFENVIKEHAQTVLRVCRVVLGAHDADDAWSETFLSAMRAYPDLAMDANVEAWLVTIAHRKAIDIIRSQKRNTIAVGELPEGVLAMSPAESVDPALWEAVKALPTKQRQSVAYHYVAGLTYGDIAGIFGGTTDAARRAASDGIKTLRTTYVVTHSKGEL